jgi:hypothetical protein
MPRRGEETVTDERSLGELSRAEALYLLASVPVGRLVFTHQALPAIRPVNHLVEDDMVVIGLTAGSAIAASSGAGGTVVAYEADSLDVAERSGWTVVVTGLARLETDSGAVLRYLARLRPWLAGAMTDVLTISSDIVTGYRLIPAVPADEVARAAE